MAFGEPVRSRDNVGSWCVGSQSRGNNGCLLEREGLRLQGSGLERLPTNVN